MSLNLAPLLVLGGKKQLVERNTEFAQQQQLLSPADKKPTVREKSFIQGKRYVTVKVMCRDTLVISQISFLLISTERTTIKASLLCSRFGKKNPFIQTTRYVTVEVMCRDTLVIFQISFLLIFTERTTKKALLLCLRFGKPFQLGHTLRYCESNVQRHISNFSNVISVNFHRPNHKKGITFVLTVRKKPFS